MAKIFPETENNELLADFVSYCQEHPHERFWQALRNWSGWSFIVAGTSYDEIQGRQSDTFYWRGKNG